ncbi:MAG: ABC transporter permease [Proteobacteria bacterium]|nr:ABC transporter permease [Pseudomonadota bacterium]MCH9758380.1 ABC transporter permease [Pseudomonadota bacterium]
MNRHNLLLFCAAAVVVFFLAMALFAPLIAPYEVGESVSDAWEDSSAAFPLGTDNLGRDMLTRLIYGARTTILIALAATLLSFFVGSISGLLAASRRGWLDSILSRTVDLLLSFPPLIFALVMLSVLPVNHFTLITIMAFLDFTRVFRLSRAASLSIVTSDFYEAAKLRGETTLYLLRHEILPNILPPLLSEFGLRFSFMILFLSSLSFLGLGVQPPDADWGSLVKENKDGIAFGITAPLVPATAIALLVVSVNILVDGVVNRVVRGDKQR